MWSNHLALKVKSILSIFINSIRRFMGLSKHQEHGMNVLEIFYGLKQAPRTWYECLRDFLIDNGIRIGKGDSTLFTRRMGNYLFVCQIYVDDIIFGSTNKSFCDAQPPSN
jgi:hypothetical protein